MTARQTLAANLLQAHQQLAHAGTPDPDDLHQRLAAKLHEPAADLIDELLIEVCKALLAEGSFPVGSNARQMALSLVDPPSAYDGGYFV